MIEPIEQMVILGLLSCDRRKIRWKKLSRRHLGTRSIPVAKYPNDDAKDKDESVLKHDI